MASSNKGILFFFDLELGRVSLGFELQLGFLGFHMNTREKTVKLHKSF